MKALLVICAVVGLALGIGASCGPQRPYCPNPDDPTHGPDNNCITNSEAGAVGGNGGGGGSRCPDGGSISLNGDNCVCMPFGQAPYPCAF